MYVKRRRASPSSCQFESKGVKDSLSSLHRLDNKRHNRTRYRPWAEPLVYITREHRAPNPDCHTTAKLVVRFCHSSLMVNKLGAIANRRLEKISPPSGYRPNALTAYHGAKWANDR